MNNTLTDATLELLFSTADKYKAYAPWEWVPNDDIFCVEDPRDGRRGCCCIMGNGRETFGLGVYRDSEGLRYILDLMNDGKADDYTRFSIHCVSVTFENASKLSREDKALIKRSGRTYKGQYGYPQFTTMMPGKIQRIPNEEEALFLCCAIEQAMAVADQLELDPDCLLDGRPRMMIRRRTAEKGAPAWKNTWSDLLPLILDTFPIDLRIAAFAQSAERIPISEAAVWICDMRFLPIPIMDDAEGGPYFGLVLMLFDRKSEQFLGMTAAKHETFHTELMEMVHKTILSAGIRPKRIDAIRPEVFVTLDRYEYPITVDLNRSHDISFVDEVWKDLVAYQPSTRRRKK
jgi:hypothetical protein